MKFRVWDISYKDWVKNDCVAVDAEGRIITYRQGGILPIWIQDNNENFIIQQFIGLTDAKGNEVYEGDIIRDRYGGVTVVEAKKEFSCGCCGYVYGYVIDHHGFEVIGNVCENEDLVKEEKE